MANIATTFAAQVLKTATTAPRMKTSNQDEIGGDNKHEATAAVPRQAAPPAAASKEPITIVLD